MTQHPRSHAQLLQKQIFRRWQLVKSQQRQCIGRIAVQLRQHVTHPVFKGGDGHQAGGRVLLSLLFQLLMGLLQLPGLTAKMAQLLLQLFQADPGTGGAIRNPTPAVKLSGQLFQALAEPVVRSAQRTHLPTAFNRQRLPQSPPPLSQLLQSTGHPMTLTYQIPGQQHRQQCRSGHQQKRIISPLLLQLLLGLCQCVHIQTTAQRPLPGGEVLGVTAFGQQHALIGRVRPLVIDKATTGGRHPVQLFYQRLTGGVLHTHNIGTHQLFNTVTDGDSLSIAHKDIIAALVAHGRDHLQGPGFCLGLGQFTGTHPGIKMF